MHTSCLQSKLVGGRLAGAVVGLLTAICLFVLGCAKPAPPDTFEEPEQLGTAQGALVTLTSVSVTPPTATLPIAVTQVYKAAGLYSNGTTRTFTSGITWSSSAPAVATIGPDGTATSVGTGVATITALHAATGLSATASLTVTAETLVSVAVTPVTKSTGNSATVAYTATGKFSGGTSVALKGAVVAWSSSDAAIAPVDAAGKVLTAATGTGIARISATHVPTGIAAPAAQLQVVASPLASITVTGSISALIGTPVPFHATGVHANGMTSDLTAVAVWTSSKPTVATITPGGVAITVAAGNTTIRATFSGRAGTAPLNVPAPVLVGLAVTPPTPRINMGTTGQLFATGTYNDLSSRDRTEQSAWSSSAPTIVKVSATAGTRGRLFPLKVGSATITARDAATGLLASTLVTVTNITLTGLAITPANVSAPLGSSAPFQATATYSDATTSDVTTTVTWSATGGAATISNAAGSQGVATSSAPGVATITAQVPATAITANATLTVTPAVLTRVEVSPATSSFVRGLTAQLTATGVYSDGARVDLTTEVGWTSSDDLLVTVSNDPGTQGLARTYAGLGTATVTATHPGSGLSATATMTVTEPALLGINLIEGIRPLFAVGDSFTMQALGFYASGPAFTLNEQLLWESSDTSLIVVSNAPGSKGRMTAVGVGTATITATDPVSGIVGTRTYTADPPRVVAFSITPTTAETEVDVLYTFSAFGTYSDGSVGPVAPEWQIVGAGGTITPEGAATASSVGTFDVRARVAQLTPIAHATLTVVPKSIKLAVGREHACALLQNGKVKCWGYDRSLGDEVTRGDEPGELGANTPEVALGTGVHATQIVAGQHFTCAITQDGRVKCWGANAAVIMPPYSFQPGGMGDALPYVDLGTNVTVSSLSTAGDANHVCAVLADGGIKCWGDNLFGQLGLGDNRPRSLAADMGDNLPRVDIGTGRKARRVAVGPYMTCAVLDDNTVKCWGLNSWGMLGYLPALGQIVGAQPGQMGDALPAIDLGTGARAVAVSIGNRSVCAQLGDGRLKCWGSNVTGALGLEAPGERNFPNLGDALLPVDLGTGRSLVQIASGEFHNCARFVDGSIVCWGYGFYGGLGSGSTSIVGDQAGQMGSSLSPVSLGTGRTARLVEAGGFSTCAVLDNDTVKCWGWNPVGNLGVGDTLNRGNQPGQMGDALPAVDLTPCPFDVQNDPLNCRLPGLVCASGTCTNGVCAALTCTPPPAGLISSWRGDGDATDALHVRDGVANGGTSFAAGKVGQSFLFNEGFVSASSTGLPLGSADRTLEAWVRLDALNPTGEAFFVGYGPFGTYESTFGLGTTPGGQIFFSQWGIGLYGPSIVVGQWTHLAATSVGSVVTLYVNGSNVAQAAMTLNTQQSDLVIGAIPGDTFRRLYGAVDEVAVYDRALSEAEILTIVNAGAGGKCH